MLVSMIIALESLLVNLQQVFGKVGGCQARHVYRFHCVNNGLG